MHILHRRVAGAHPTSADVRDSTSSMHRQACVRLLPSLSRVRTFQQSDNLFCRAFAAQTGEPKVTPALLDKIKDKELLKVHGFIGGQWVSASDGSTMEVSSCTITCC